MGPERHGPQRLVDDDVALKGPGWLEARRAVGDGVRKEPIKGPSRATTVGEDSMGRKVHPVVKIRELG